MKISFATVFVLKDTRTDPPRHHFRRELVPNSLIRRISEGETYTHAIFMYKSLRNDMVFTYFRFGLYLFPFLFKLTIRKDKKYLKLV